MRSNWILFSVALLLVGCAERDNPFDPANRSVSQRAADTAFVPVPGPYTRVVMRESASVSRDRDFPYYFYGNPQTALSESDAGDTIWIHGGDSFYRVFGRLTISHGGTDLMPVVVRSFGGTAVIRSDSTSGSKVDVCLDIKAPYVKVVGFAFMNCEIGITAWGNKGPISLDSIKIENTQRAMDIRQVDGLVKLHHITMTNNVDTPPYYFSQNKAIDTLDFKWTPRVTGGI